MDIAVEASLSLFIPGRGCRRQDAAWQDAGTPLAPHDAFSSDSRR